MTWLLCDYGEVLSCAQPEADRAALVAASGRDDTEFWHAYWAHRPGYDRADISAQAYWERVLDTPVDGGRLQDLIVLDVTSWLHGNQASLAAVARAGRRGYRLAILSNAPIELANALERVSWLTGFETRMFSCYLRLSKPDPAVYRRVLDCLRADPEEIIFFDDRPDNVAAAGSIGIRAHRFTDPSQLEELPAL